MKAKIGTVRIDPDNVTSGTGECIIELPQGTHVLSPGWVGDAFVLWVAVPIALIGEALPTQKRRLWVLPGAMLIDFPTSAAHIGSVLIPYDNGADGVAVDDWHVFLDTNLSGIEGPAHFAYKMH